MSLDAAAVGFAAVVVAGVADADAAGFDAVAAGVEAADFDAAVGGPDVLLLVLHAATATATATALTDPAMILFMFYLVQVADAEPDEASAKRLAELSPSGLPTHYWSYAWYLSNIVVSE